MPLPAIFALGGSALLSGAGSEASRKATIEGAELQAEQEKLGREAQARQFEKAIERQQPFLEAGQRALPQLSQAIAGQQDVTALPGFQAQSRLMREGLQGFGGETPQFVLDRAGQMLEGVEAEKGKGRLLDLIQTGLGAAGAAGQARVDLGSALGRSLATQGAGTAQALQQAATQRQDLATGAVDYFAGIPSVLSSAQQKPQFNAPGSAQYGFYGPVR